MDPNWLTIKVVVWEGCNGRWVAVIGWIDVVSHHLQSILSAIELTILCDSYAKYGSLMLMLGQLY